MKQFTSTQRHMILQMRKRGYQMRRIANELHCGTQSISRVLRENGVNLHLHELPEYIPTPEDIERETINIQASWSKGEEASRAGHVQGWMPPIVVSPETAARRVGRRLCKLHNS